LVTLIGTNVYNGISNRKYFNRGVMALDAPHISHVVKETDHNLEVFGENNKRFDIPISEIKNKVWIVMLF
jgi:hypothetical protein